MSESDSFEEKSHFDWTPKQSLGLVKDLAAFANTIGGRIRLNGVQCTTNHLDSAKIDDFVNGKVAPRIDGIVSTTISEGVWEISVPASNSAPHVLTGDLSFPDNGKTKCIGRRGEVYVRHSSKTELATSEDYQRIFQKKLGFWLGKIGQAVQTLSLDVGEGQLALPVKLSDEGTALKIGIADPNRDYPYNASQLDRKLGKKNGWSAAAIKRLNIKTNPILALGILGSNGQPCLWKYNDRTLKTLRDKLAEDPNFHPYGPQQRRRR